MAGAGGLHNPLYFPVFSALPQVDDYDCAYYSETAQNMLVPSRTWCFVGEIVSDALAGMAVLGHRVEVRDMAGETHSIMFYPEAGHLDMSLLRTGHTIFIRYAHRCFFSDLSSEAIKVEDLNMVHVVPADLDSLLYVSGAFFSESSHCAQCHGDLAAARGLVRQCGECGSCAYCSDQCLAANAPQHATFCFYCRQLRPVFGVDFERWTQYVPFR